MQGEGQRSRPSSLPGTPFIFQGQEFWVPALKRMPKMKCALAGRPGLFVFNEDQALLSQHICQLFYSCWAICIVSRSEMLDKNLAEGPEENPPVQQRNLPLCPLPRHFKALTTSYFYYFFFVFFSRKYEQCVLHPKVSVGKLYFSLVGS